jgi:hypothetical protein
MPPVAIIAVGAKQPQDLVEAEALEGRLDKDEQQSIQQIQRNVREDRSTKVRSRHR